MKKVSLSGSPRGGVGKKDAKALRAAGQIPAILYGGENQVALSINAIAFDKIYYSPNVYQIELDIDGKQSWCVIKDLQLHPVSGKVLHIDFYELHEDKPVTVSLPVKTSGNSLGVLNGGALIMNFRKIKVKAIPANLPESIIIDITDLKIGDMVRIKDVEVEGCTIIQDPQAVVLAVKVTRAALAADLGEVEGEADEAEATEEAAAE